MCEELRTISKLGTLEHRRPWPNKTIAIHITMSSIAGFYYKTLQTSNHEKDCETVLIAPDVHFVVTTVHERRMVCEHGRFYIGFVIHRDIIASVQNCDVNQVKSDNKSRWFWK
jgi:hypothetical protein